MKTDTNLHVQLEGLVRELVPIERPAQTRPLVLDLGCGEGALAQRLCDLGYEVLAADVDRAQFKAEGPAFLAVDLNDPAAAERLAAACPRQPDLLLAVEVIEHLRSPWDFVALCRRLCGQKTELVITTPNVASWWGRLWFLLTGELWGFGPESWREPGHINPITPTEMQGILRASGFECLAVSPAGSLPVIWAYNGKRLAASLLMLPLRPLMRGPKDGWVLCYHARRAGGH